MKYWLVKSEPFKYAWDKFVADGETFWDGVRNYQARNNMKAMSVGDQVLFYHSNEGMEVVGIAEVSAAAYQDPTTDDERWVVVNLKPVKKLKKPVTLATMKETPELENMSLIRQSRLSVCDLSKEEFKLVVKMGS
ncbi:EVE domain-containing protein [Taibaiella soli]|uniref:EVE domain-containing protein n=1 Tax=Taibaiella soli TaxID=1649169 RepID=A0A2W2A7A3_9BACT|nr:EVE domain-containing protein [Taibaiella soli]PZF71205.1 EVE domain-containing protein [Taibaiella soli]